MNITLFGRHVLWERSYIIMRLDFKDINKVRTVNAKSNSLLEIKRDNMFLLENCSFGKKRMMDMCKDTSAETYCLWNGKEPIGFLGVIHKGNKDEFFKIRSIDAYLSEVSVNEKFRGNNYCAEMIISVADILESKGMTNTYLAVREDNYNAIHAYEKIGFKRVDTKQFYRFFGVNIPHFSL